MIYLDVFGGAVAAGLDGIGGMRILADVEVMGAELARKERDRLRDCSASEEQRRTPWRDQFMMN